MNRAVQILLYSAFAVAIGYFSVLPAYQYSDPELATIKLSLSHAGHRVKECVTLTPDEINARALRGERLNECERERLPISIELDVDDKTVLQLTAAPSGLWKDGPASVYERIEVAAGKHTIAVRLRDSARAQGWDYNHSETVNLEAGHYFTVTFRAETGGFTCR